MVDFDGKEYGKASMHQREWGMKILAKLPLLGAEEILDLGCGDGVVTREIAQMVSKGRVIGIDSSKSMIDAAKERATDNLQFLLLDINDMQFDNQFDLVFSNAALHWVKDHNKLMTNVYKSLKPGGWVRFNFAGEGNCANLYLVVKEVMERPEYNKCFLGFEWPWYMPNIQEYETIICQFSFKQLSIWEENADRYFASSEEMIKWIDQPSIVPFQRHAPEEVRKDFRNAVVEKMLEITRRENGTYFETFRRINVLARK